MLPGSTYHLFNHGNGRENLFAEHKNYDFFLNRLSLHVLPIAFVYAYCLMPNHFHLLLKIKEQKILTEYFRQLEESRVRQLIGSIEVSLPALKLDEFELIRKISRSFSNCFNSYTQAFNKMYKRRGSLFMPNMKTEEIFNNDSFRRVVRYIHTNPVHHGFVKKIDKWPHSSYRLFLNNSSAKLKTDHVFKVFDGLDNFIKYHEDPYNHEQKWFDI